MKPKIYQILFKNISPFWFQIFFPQKEKAGQVIYRTNMYDVSDKKKVQFNFCWTPEIRNCSISEFLISN